MKDTADVTSFMDWKWRNDNLPTAYTSHIQRNTCTTNCWQDFGSSNQRPQRGTWETYEIYVKLNNIPVDAGGQGRIRAWKNGRLVGDLTANRTLNNTSDLVKSALIFSYWNGCAPKTQHVYFDDLVATNVRPSAVDSNGYPYIGVGGFVAMAPPMPPGSIR